MTTTDAVRLTSGELWTQWLIVTAGGGFIGWILGVVVGFVVAVIVTKPFEFVVMALIAGALTGCAIALGQGFVFQPYLAAPAFAQFRPQWIIATTIGGSIALSFFVAPLNYGLPHYLVMGIAALLLAAIQWAVLRRYVRGALWWIPASVAAWVIGAGVVVGVVGLFPPGTEPDLSAAFGYIICVSIMSVELCIAIWGALTGGVIVWLLRRHAPA